MLTKGQVDLAYTALVKGFREAAKNLSVRCNNSRGFVSQLTDDGGVKVNTFIFMPNWKYRGAKTGKIINILLRGSEIFSGNTGLMTKSTIQVMYLDIENGKAIPLLALHYDFEELIKPAHPCFHVQFGVTDVQPQECKAIGLYAALQPPITPFYPSVRIPTPHMGLGAVLVGIAADHLPPADSKSFLAQVRSNSLTSCETACATLVTNHATHGGHKWHSHHWYD